MRTAALFPETMLYSEYLANVSEMADQTARKAVVALQVAHLAVAVGHVAPQ